MTLEEFYEAVSQLPEAYANRDLEAYLLALLWLVEERKSETPTLPLLLRILSDAFTAPPAVFQEAWLDITEAPDPNRLSRKFNHPDLEFVPDRSNASSFRGN